MANSNPDADRRHYLGQILSYETNHLDDLLATRRRLLGRQDLPSPKAPRETRRMQLENQMLHLEATLFQPDSPAWQQPPSHADFDAYPLLQQRFEQLSRLFALRDRFLAAETDPALDPDFLIWYKRLVSAPLQLMKQWRGFTQAYFQEGTYLAEIAAQISRLQSHYPELFALQAEWFQHILERPPRGWKTIF
ncbi:hypothetical protein [Acanthopleuribacter pedis]|uniref:Uncharacterized protein n=1 Tax=Acanthopleuribacter pedis TaxID=442870 RepID=A0A8J7QPR1_9BACT|nr:hypothetical protein [Acanthopleuribacter pedis]MBO1322403.1 hypothetical protein [Acanthopleuribacter pedis]